MNRLSQETREGIVHSLVECASQRSCERRYKVSNKTVAKLANDVGEMAIHHIARTRGLRVRQIQADELWAFVKVKQKNIARQKVQEVGAGTVWTYLAICSDTKLIVGYRLGDRKLADARAFYQSIRDKLEVDENRTGSETANAERVLINLYFVSVRWGPHDPAEKIVHLQCVCG